MAAAAFAAIRSAAAAAAAATANFISAGTSSGGGERPGFAPKIFSPNSDGRRRRAAGAPAAPRQGRGFHRSPSPSASPKASRAARAGWCCRMANRSTSRFPPGLKDGQQIRVKGRGGAGRNGGPNGDILIQVSVAPHPYHHPRRQRPAHGPAGDAERSGAGRQGAGADPERHGQSFHSRQLQHRRGAAAEGQGRRRPMAAKRRAIFMCGWW